MTAVAPLKNLAERFREHVEDPNHVAARNALINDILDQAFDRVFGDRDVSLRADPY